MTAPIDIPVPGGPYTNGDGSTSQNSSFSSTSSNLGASPKPKKKTNRCVVCKKKVGLLPFICECELMFCSTHRHPEDHNCKFDHRGKSTKTLERNLVKVDGDRVHNRL